MKKIILIGLYCGLLIMIATACSANDDNNNLNSSGMDLPTEMIEVDLQLQETAEPGETIEIPTLVTLSDEPVEDADKIEYEIWKQGMGDHSQKFAPEHQGDGVYTLNHAFAEDGVYYVIAHVTVNDLHRMPRKSIAVGEVTQEELDREEEHSGSMDGGTANMDHGDNAKMNGEHNE